MTKIQKTYVKLGHVMPCAKSCKKQIWFGQRGGVNMFKGLVMFWGPVWPNTVGPVSGQPGFGSQKIKMHYVSHGHVMPCAKPCKKQILFGQRGGVNRFKGLVMFGGTVWPNTVGLVSGQPILGSQNFNLHYFNLGHVMPCAKSCKKQISFGYRGGVKVVEMKVAM